MHRLAPEAKYDPAEARRHMTRETMRARDLGSNTGDVLVYEGDQVHRNLARRIREIDPDGQRSYELLLEMSSAISRQHEK